MNISAVLQVIFLFLFLYIFKLNIYGAILAYGCMLLFSLFMTILYLYRAGHKLQCQPYLRIIPDLYKYSMKNYFGTIFQSFNYRLDMLLVAYFLNSSDVGLYTAAVSIAELVWYIPDSISYILFPYTSASSSKQANHFTPIVIRNALFLTLIAALVLFLIAPWILSLLFGGSFIGAIMPVRILLPGIIALGLWKVICNDMAGRGLPQYKSYSAGLSLFFTVLLDFVLIPRFGISGAAIASSLAYTIAAVSVVLWFLKISKVRVCDILFLSYPDIQYIKNSLIKVLSYLMRK